MADKLEFNDDFSFRDLFGKKKSKQEDDQTARIPIYPEENHLLESGQPGDKTHRRTSPSGAYTDLDFPLIRFTDNPADTWTLSDAVRGVQIFGGIGSGKSSGSGKLLALTFLKNGFGGLVLCGKPDERENWEKYAKATGRYDDLIIFDKKSKYEFNPLIYEQNRQSEGAGETANIVNLFMSIYKLGQRISGSDAKSSDRFWDNALRRMLNRIIDLLKLAGEELSVSNMIEIVTTAPYGEDYLLHIGELKAQEEATGNDDLLRVWHMENYCTACIWVASDKVDLETDEELLAEKNELFSSVQRYFLKELATLAHETHSSLLETLYGITEPFQSGILARQFAKGLDEEINPEITFNNEENRGKIIIIDYPVKSYLEAGIYAQGIYKLLWQQAVERRKIDTDQEAVPVFLWADESQFFVSEYDMLFQTTARSSRACTVFLTQNISNYYAMMGGENARARVDSLLGNLSTKIFHANNDYETNQWAANTIGKMFQNMDSAGFAFQLAKTGIPSMSSGVTEQLHYQVEPREFTTLKSGGKQNEFKVEGYIVTAGKEWSDPDNGKLKNHKKLTIFQLPDKV